MITDFNIETGSTVEKKFRWSGEYPSLSADVFKGYYTENGYYFITICTKNRK